MLNLKEDHLSTINASKELIFLNIQSEKEKFINSIKIQIIDWRRRNYRNQLEKLEQNLQQEHNKLVKQLEDDCESEYKSALESHLRSKKDTEEKEEIMRKLVKTVRENNTLQRKLNILNDKLDSYSSFVAYTNFSSLSNPGSEVGIGILNQEHKRVQNLLSDIKSEESKLKPVDEEELTQLEKQLIEK